MIQSGRPFARKFDIEIDRSVIEKLPTPDAAALDSSGA